MRFWKIGFWGTRLGYGWVGQGSIGEKRSAFGVEESV